MVERVLELQPLLLRTLRLPLPQEVLGRLGTVTPHQLEALSHLPSHGISMHEFAESVGISGTAATALADRMIRQGLAQRLYDPGDRRTVRLAPTPMGLETSDDLREWRRRSVIEMLERLDPEQVSGFLEALSTLFPAPSGELPVEAAPEAGSG
ncbi:MAG: MarR family winged helix-turn-helix transcriptional regulator [Candidatus Dormibacteria bacterium]